jgi:uncharacterized protein with FMN-binding domain
MVLGRSFFSRIVSCFIIVAALFYYNQMTTLNGEIIKANTQIEKMVAAQTVNIEDGATPLAVPEGPYKNGVYNGTAQGYGGPVTAQIVVEGGDAVSIEITSADFEDAPYYNMCLDILDHILETQGTDVDTVSGATLTSNGIIGGAKEAFSQAVK